MSPKTVLSKLSIMALLVMPLSAAPVSARSLLQSGVPVDALIMRAGSTAGKISRINAVPSVGVVNLRHVARPRIYSDSDWDTVDDFRLNIDGNYSGIKRLRNALKSNPVTRRALSTRGIAVSRVVAADVSSNGSLRLYLF
jgi:hypothetical protein